MPSQRDTARSGLKALSVRIERNAGMSAAPAIIAPKLINESLFRLFENIFNIFGVENFVENVFVPKLCTYHYDNEIKPTPCVCKIHLKT
jgi:hypothetical protein